MDPLGFAWESALCLTQCSGLTSAQHAKASRFRQEYLSRSGGPLPEGVRIPFVFWPLQLESDLVNKYDLNLPDWYDVLLWTRQIIPTGYQR
jgi:hypothetical protein